MEQTLTVELFTVICIGLFILLTLLFLAYAVVEVYNLHRQIEVKDAKISNLSYDLKNVKDHNSELKGKIKQAEDTMDKMTDRYIEDKIKKIYKGE